MWYLRSKRIGLFRGFLVLEKVTCSTPEVLPNNLPTLRNRLLLLILLIIIFSEP